MILNKLTPIAKGYYGVPTELKEECYKTTAGGVE